MKKLMLSLPAILFLGTAGVALAQETAFTYQGRLNDDTGPVSGLYDIAFFLYGTESRMPLAAQTNTAVVVTGGLFTTTVDFGSNFFATASSYKIGIGVRTNGDGEFSGLVPPQSLTPAPLAIAALTARTASNLASNADVTSARLKIGQNPILTGTSSTIAGGSANSALADYATVSGGSGNTASGDYAAVSGGIANTASGNGATVVGGESNAATNILATVVGGDHNIAGGRYSFAAGRQAQALHDGSFVWADSTGGSFLSSGSNQFLIRAGGGVGINTFFPLGALDVNGDVVLRGKVGIGNTNSASRLSVQTTGGDYGIEHYDGGTRLATYVEPGAGWFGTLTPDPLYFYVNDGGPALAIASDSKVGIGTSIPQTLLQIGGTPNSEAMIRMASRAADDSGARTWDIGVPKDDSIYSGKFFSFVIDDTGLGSEPEFLIQWGTGNVGIGTTEPASRLTVAGTVESTSGGFKFPDGSVQTTANPASGSVPIGTVLDWWRPNGTFPVPSGYAICDGSLINNADSPFNGSTLPNLNGKFVRGVTNPLNIGTPGGNDTHVHSGTTSIAGAHAHGLSTTGSQNGTGLAVLSLSGALTTTDGSHTHSVTIFQGDNIPAYVGLLKIMRIQ